MTRNHKHEGTGLEPDRDEELWELLGKARPVRVSPYFARRVLRDLDAGDAPAHGWLAWRLPGWIVASSTAAVAIVLGFLSFSSIPVAQAPPMAQRQAVLRVSPVPRAAASTPSAAGVFEVADDVSPQDIDVIADLDNLVAREETNEWTDDDTSRF
jgi:hypothetical protein